MDNQQERLEKDWHWLGGIYDGEGSINIICAKRGPRWQLNPQCSLTNTADTMIEEAIRILSESEIPYHVMSVSKTIGAKDIKRLTVTGSKRCLKFLTKLRPYLRTKRNEADIVLAWIESRFSRPIGEKYSQQEIDWYAELRSLHGKRTPVSPETIRRELQRQNAA